MVGDQELGNIMRQDQEQLCQRPIKDDCEIGGRAGIVQGGQRKTQDFGEVGPQLNGECQCQLPLIA